MKLKPVIFLDFDGVLHPVSNAPLPSTWAEVEREIGRRYFHVPAVALLNCLSARLDADIVLISSWKFLGFPLSAYSYLFNHRLVDQTTECPGQPLPSRREEEIMQFLERDDSKRPFLIIDDQKHHYDLLMPWLVSPESSVGLTEFDIVDACKVLALHQSATQYEWEIEVARLPR